jgi:hypothetical protein
MKRNWIKRILGGLSFTSALFIFQACYGTGPDIMMDTLIEGQVTARSTGLTIPGVKVSVEETGQYQITGSTGKFSFFTLISDSLTIRFEDIDSIQNGSFYARDTILTTTGDPVVLNITMEEK